MLYAAVSSIGSRGFVSVFRCQPCWAHPLKQSGCWLRCQTPADQQWATLQNVKLQQLQHPGPSMQTRCGPAPFLHGAATAMPPSNLTMILPVLPTACTFSCIFRQAGFPSRLGKSCDAPAHCGPQNTLHFVVCARGSSLATQQELRPAHSTPASGVKASTHLRSAGFATVPAVSTLQRGGDVSGGACILLPP